MAIKLIKGRFKGSTKPKNKDNVNLQLNSEIQISRLKDKKFKLLSYSNFIYKAYSIFHMDSPLKVLDEAFFYLKFTCSII